jgi:hypothetical protein
MRCFGRRFRINMTTKPRIIEILLVVTLIANAFLLGFITGWEYGYDYDDTEISREQAIKGKAQDLLYAKFKQLLEGNHD